jgi:hypothetical protein
MPLTKANGVGFTFTARNRKLFSAIGAFEKFKKPVEDPNTEDSRQTYTEFYY